MNIFSERLRKLRQNRNWTMKELGERISKIADSPFSSASVANWEKKGSEPPYNILAAIAQVFDVSADYLIGIGNTPNQDSKLSTDEIKHKQDIINNIELYLTINEHERKQNIYKKVKDLHQQILVLPPKRQERLEKELTEYLKFFEYKYDQLHIDFDNFTNYLQHELKTSKN
ncbi:XRE family transcriptional regulator (plasmid) [Bacillus mycoides]|uniref:helix-turn-helix domain-containing protein n=1 Tax=Bacillus mycoides TaxID=1405 RepID=UPI001C0367D1|nr:helix-turn-helix transcriptional regulator [Bacillus mycoides]QWH76024.1 XRE family transcriptional regulator [Bacillus mycoides]